MVSNTQMSIESWATLPLASAAYTTMRCMPKSEQLKVSVSAPLMFKVSMPQLSVVPLLIWLKVSWACNGLPARYKVSVCKLICGAKVSSTVTATLSKAVMPPYVNAKTT